MEVLTHRLGRLQDVAHHLIGAASSTDVAAVVMTVVDTPRPTASRGLWLTRSDDAPLVLVDHRGLHPDTARRFERIAIDDDVPCAEAVSYTHLTLPTIYSV